MALFEVAAAVDDGGAAAAAGDDAALAEEGCGQEEQAEKPAAEGEPDDGFTD